MIASLFPRTVRHADAPSRDIVCGMSDATTAPPQARVRVPFWDNARFLCIVLVVAGHAVQRMSRDSDPAYAVYLLIYTFHMPAFAIMSGYFSKSTAPTLRSMRRLLTDIVAPYLIFETIWTLLDWAFSGRLNLDYSSASWTLWFLIALAVFRVVLPYLALLRWPVLWTVLIAVGAGYVPAIDSTFAMNRVLQLMPFFVIGWWLKEHDVIARFGLLARRSWPATVAAGALMVGTFAVIWLNAGELRAENLHRWFFFKQTFDELSLPGGASPGGWGGLIRLGVIAFALLMCAAFFMLVPRGDYRWTHLGQYTLYVYLLHTFVLFPLRETSNGEGQNITAALEPQWLWLLIALVASVLIAVVLSSKPVRWLTRPLVEPNISWLLVREPEPVRR